MGDIETDRITVLVGDVLERLADLPDDSVHMCVTSPPYWGLRDYGEDDQLGLEPTPEEYVENMVRVFREVRRVLRPDGTLWLNLGDSFDNKQLQGIPWRVAFALQQDNWWLRSDIIWAKGISLDERMGSCMPESVTDRPTSAHEHIFLLSPSEKYFYDHEAIKEDSLHGEDQRAGEGNIRYGGKRNGEDGTGQESFVTITQKSNIRNVWHTSPESFPDAHFAVYPPNLIRPCIKAGTSQEGACVDCGAPWARVVDKEKVRISDSPRFFGVSMRNDAEDGRSTTTTTTIGWEPTCDCDIDETTPCTVLDPFLGSGTTALVALQEGRNAVGIELNPDYVDIIKKRVGEWMNQARLDEW